MRRLVLVCFAALAASMTTGCIISSGDDDDDTGDLGFIKANWDFSTAAGGALNCPTGFQTVIVEARGPETIDDLFDCDAFTGLSPEGHIIGDYDVTLVVADVDGAGNVLDEYASSLTFDVDLIAADVVVEEVFIDDGGRWIMDVNLLQTGTNTPETCAGGAVDAIGLTATGAGAAILIDIDCGDAEAATVIAPPIVDDTYVLSVAAVDASGNAVGPATNINTSITAPNGYTDLGVVDVDVD